MTKKTMLSLSIIILIIASIVIGVKMVQTRQEIRSKASSLEPKSAYPASASLILEPDRKMATVGGEIKVSVKVSSASESANLFVAKLNFPSDLLEVTGINLKEGVSFIKMWVENFFDNTISPGTVSLVGGIPDPGYKTVNPNGEMMAEIIFKTKKIGSATIKVASESAVYNNSNGANLLNNFQATSVEVVATLPTPTVLPTLTPTITLTSTPTPTRTPSPTPTPTRTPSPTPTATPRVTLAPTNTPVPTTIITATPTPTISGPTPTPIILVGDIDGNGKVDLIDLTFFFKKWSKSGSSAGKADLNNDGIVDQIDLNVLIQKLIQLGVI